MISSRISTKRANGNPDLTLVNTDGSQGQQISELLYFEPYALLIRGLIKKKLKTDFITELAKRIYPSCDALLPVQVSCFFYIRLMEAEMKGRRKWRWYTGQCTPR